MNLEVDLRSAILGLPGMTALVDDRVNWGELPAARPRPLISLWTITALPDYHMAGQTRLHQTFVQFDCWADSVAEAKAVADILVDQMGAYHATVGSTLFQGVFWRGRRDSHEPLSGSPAARYSRVSLDAEIWHGDG